VNIVRLKRVGRWSLEKLADAVVYLLDLLLRFLDSRGWSPQLRVKKQKNKPSTASGILSKGDQK